MRLTDFLGSRSAALHKSYTTFEKQFGNREGVEDVILAKRRVQYEDQVKADPDNYDTWFDFARLEESGGDAERVRDVYERAIAQMPSSQEKRNWRRYIYLWIMYAMWEEMTNKDVDRARQIYQECLRLIPHKKVDVGQDLAGERRNLKFDSFNYRQHGRHSDRLSECVPRTSFSVAISS